MARSEQMRTMANVIDAAKKGNKAAIKLLKTFIVGACDPEKVHTKESPIIPDSVVIEINELMLRDGEEQLTRQIEQN